MEVNPLRIDMGAVAPGDQKQATFLITNSGNQTVELARIDSSCPCLTVDVPLRVLPGEQVVGRARLDLREEPNFKGDLAIEIKGWTSTGEAAFLGVAAVRVQRKNER